MATRILAYFSLFIFLSPIYALGQGLKDVKILDNKENNKLNLQDGIQDKRRTTSRTKRKSEPTRTGRSRNIKEKPRYDVGRSDRVVRDDTIEKKVSIPIKKSHHSL